MFDVDGHAVRVDYLEYLEEIVATRAEDYAEKKGTSEDKAEKPEE